MRGLRVDQYLSASPEAGEDQFTACPSRGVVCPPEAEKDSSGQNEQWNSCNIGDFERMRPIFTPALILENEARNLSSAIAEYGTRRSPTLLAQLTFVGNRIETIDLQLHKVQPEPPNVPIERVREFVLERAADLQKILLRDRAAAKQALLTHFRPLVLSPKYTPDGPVFTVEGNMDLFSGLPDAMLLAAPQGFEPRYAAPEAAVLPLNEGATRMHMLLLQPCWQGSGKTPTTKGQLIHHKGIFCLGQTSETRNLDSPAKSHSAM